MALVRVPDGGGVTKKVILVKPSPYLLVTVGVESPVLGFFK